MDLVTAKQVSLLPSLSDSTLACLVLREAKNEYAKSYLQLIASNDPILSEKGALRTQWFYVLNNLQTWRGTLAREVKKEVKKRHKIK